MVKKSAKEINEAEVMEDLADTAAMITESIKREVGGGISTKVEEDMPVTWMNAGDETGVHPDYLKIDAKGDILFHTHPPVTTKRRKFIVEAFEAVFGRKLTSAEQERVIERYELKPSMPDMSAYIQRNVGRRPADYLKSYVIFNKKICRYGLIPHVTPVTRSRVDIWRNVGGLDSKYYTARAPNVHMRKLYVRYGFHVAQGRSVKAVDGLYERTLAGQTRAMMNYISSAVKRALEAIKSASGFLKAHLKSIRHISSTIAQAVSEGWIEEMSKRIAKTWTADVKKFNEISDFSTQLGFDSKHNEKFIKKVGGSAALAKYRRLEERFWNAFGRYKKIYFDFIDSILFFKDIAEKLASRRRIR